MHITISKLRQLIQEELENAENHSEEEERIAKLLMQMKALGYSEEDLLRIWRGEKSAGYETQ
jgi:DNA anti-recombination protein RmuC